MRNQLSYPNGNATTYGYDAYNRLTSILQQNGGTTVGSYNYTLGPAGNRVSVTEANNAATNTTINWCYDAAYRLTVEARNATCPVTAGSSTTTYTWNAADRLTIIIQPGVNASFSYDGDGRRLSKDYEYTVYSADAMIYAAMTHLMLRRLARLQAPP